MSSQYNQHRNMTIHNSPIAPLANVFNSILKSANASDFTSKNYPFIVDHDNRIPSDILQFSENTRWSPNSIDAIAHLKLLKAIGVMKKTVIESHPDIDSKKVWKTFVSNAVRRFHAFVTAINKNTPIQDTNGDSELALYTAGTNINKEFISMMDNLMPPLDVIMVWHAFLSTNTKEAYGSLVRTGLLQFANYPLPLHNIVRFINNNTFGFNVLKKYKENYLKLFKKFDAPFALTYEIKEIELYSMTVDIFCPFCKTKLADSVPFSNGENTGFVDDSFHAVNKNHWVKTSECYCFWFKIITKDELRKLQLFTDAKITGILQGSYKHFSQVISPSEQNNRNTTRPSIKIAVEVENYWNDHYHLEQTVKGLIDSLMSNLRDAESGKLLMEYLKFNPIGMTISDSVQLGFDLVQSVLKQERFISKINNMNWLQSGNVDQFLNKSCSRYANFYTMLTNPDLKDIALVPTLDIDLIWQTHKLVLQGYISDCLRSPSRCLIDESKHEGRLDNSFNVTIDLYKNFFGEDYKICYCESCISENFKVAKVSAHNVPSVNTLFNHIPGSSAATPYVSSSSGHVSPKRRKVDGPNSTLYLGTNQNNDALPVTPTAPIEEIYEGFISPSFQANTNVDSTPSGSNLASPTTPFSSYIDFAFSNVNQVFPPLDFDKAFHPLDFDIEFTNLDPSLIFIRR